jgi:hypothetical protein
MSDFIVPIGLFVFTSFVGAVLHWKSRADKAEIKDIIDLELKGRMIPIDKRLSDIERTNNYLQAAVRAIETNGKVADEKFINLIDAMDRYGDSLNKFSEKMEKLIERQDSKSRENFLLVFEKIGDLTEKVAKKADK